MLQKSGIGRELAKKLIECNANVIVVGQTQAKLDSLMDEVKDKTKITTICANLGTWIETTNKLGEICKNVDYLVNNAGWGFACPLDEVTEEDFDKLIDINLKAPINLIKLVSKGMKERKFGSIVNVSSQAGIAALDEHIAYGATKAGLDLVTKVSAKELGPYNIRVNSVNPTVVWTPMGKDYWSEPKRYDTMTSRIPLGRFAEVEEVVNPIIFLLSDKSSMISGITMPIDGGFIAT